MRPAPAKLVAGRQPSGAEVKIVPAARAIAARVTVQTALVQGPAREPVGREVTAPGPVGQERAPVEPEQVEQGQAVQAPAGVPAGDGNLL